MTTSDTRQLSAEELAILHSLQLKKERRQPFEAYVTTAAEIPFGSKPGGKGPWNGDYIRLIPPGKTMRIVMVSRLGDFGLTDHLAETHGYGVRLAFDSALITNLRTTP